MLKSMPTWILEAPTTVLHLACVPFNMLSHRQYNERTALFTFAVSCSNIYPYPASFIIINLSMYRDENEIQCYSYW